MGLKIKWRNISGNRGLKETTQQVKVIMIHAGTFLVRLQDFYFDLIWNGHGSRIREQNSYTIISRIFFANGLFGREETEMQIDIEKDQI